MNEFLKNIIMGLVQGISEFLPISSSGHLVLFGDFLDVSSVSGSKLLLSVMVHLGTLAAVIIYYRLQLWLMIKQVPKLPAFITQGFKVKQEDDEQCHRICRIVLATIPAVIIGFSCKDLITEHLMTREAVLLALSVNALILWSSKYCGEKGTRMSWIQALLIGCGQAFAIMPGISRSGTTIVIALWMGLSRERSASFSFLMSIPVILGASLLEMKDIMDVFVVTNL